MLDTAHIGDIRGALGTIAVDDTAARRGWRAYLRTLLAIAGPGLIVMVGDNDAGPFGTPTFRTFPGSEPLPYPGPIPVVEEGCHPGRLRRDADGPLRSPNRPSGEARRSWST